MGTYILVVELTLMIIAFLIFYALYRNNIEKYKKEILHNDCFYMNSEEFGVIKNLIKKEIIKKKTSTNGQMYSDSLKSSIKTKELELNSISNKDRRGKL